jgi:hypothetical protein
LHEFGRRLLLLFVGCALVPIAVVALVSYRHVSRHLLAQSEARLHQANKALGSAIFERLLLLDATLNSIPPRAILQLAGGQKAAASSPAPPATPARPPARLDGAAALGGPRTPAHRAQSPTGAQVATAGDRVNRTLVAGVDLSGGSSPSSSWATTDRAPPSSDGSSGYPG